MDLLSQIKQFIGSNQPKQNPFKFNPATIQNVAKGAYNTFVPASVRIPYQQLNAAQRFITQQPQFKDFSKQLINNVALQNPISKITLPNVQRPNYTKMVGTALQKTTIPSEIYQPNKPIAPSIGNFAIDLIPQTLKSAGNTLTRLSEGQFAKGGVGNAFEDISNVGSLLPIGAVLRTAKTEGSSAIRLANKAQTFEEFSKLYRKAEPEAKAFVGGILNSKSNTINTLEDFFKAVKAKGISPAALRTDLKPGAFTNVTNVDNPLVTKVGKKVAGEDTALSLLDNVINWKDKPTLFYQRERLDRNLESVAGKDAPELIKRYFAPVQKAEADRMRFLNEQRSQIRGLGIQPKSKESQAIQLLGEKKMTQAELIQQFPTSWQKLVNAEKFIRGKYDEYITDINKALQRNGYEPVPKRKDYFLHFQELGNVLERFGIPVRDNAIPSDIVGLTADFKPGRNFFTSGLPRLTEKTDYDAIQGIDRYLENASKQIFHVDNIRSLRQFENALRERLAGSTKMSGLVANLTEYTNLLAGKKSLLDRGAEALFGRKIYGGAQRVRQQTGANMVGANISSSLTNFIPLTQSLATTNKASFAKGLLEAAISPLRNDGLIDKSDFLTRRLGSDRLYVGKWDKVAEKGGLMFKYIDRFVSESIFRGKYDELISKGFNEKEAMRVADDYASRLIGDRSLGSQPNLFGSQTASFFTQFQLEVNNQVSFLFKDIPKMNNSSKIAVTSALAQVALYSYLYNELYEKFFGRRPALDPIGVGVQSYEDYNNPDIKAGQATKNLAQNVVNQVPFANALTGGRLPIGSTIPNFFAVTQGESTLGKELVKPLPYLLPTGGGQIKKSYEGYNAFKQGASLTPSGKVRYPIENNDANLFKTLIGGQYSTPEAREYFRQGYQPLGDKDSAAIKSLPASDRLEFYKDILQERKERKIDDAAKASLRTSDASVKQGEGKYYLKQPNGDIRIVEKNIDFKPPQMTGNPNVDRYALENYRDTIGQRISDAYDLAENGAISQDGARREIERLLSTHNALRKTLNKTKTVDRTFEDIVAMKTESKLSSQSATIFSQLSQGKITSTEAERLLLQLQSQTIAPKKIAAAKKGKKGKKVKLAKIKAYKEKPIKLKKLKKLKIATLKLSKSKKVRTS